jgi:mannose-6-phosphate isomerase-like protein (cupin superfamily)
MSETVDLWHLYPRPDGVSTFECLKVELKDGRSGVFASDHIQIAQLAPHYKVDWHNVSERTLVATIGGSGEMEAGDGQKIELKPGTMVLIEDLTGHGHRSSNGPDGRLALFLPIADGVSI